MNDTKLRAALIEARDWFESQAKAVSKGCGSSYELHDLRVQRDALDAALAAPAREVAPTSHPVAMPEPHYGKGRYLGFARYNDAYSAAQVQAMRHGSDAALKSRLLTALERASLAECALRALIDECESDSIPGWEDRMNARINAGNAMLAAAPSGPVREPLTDEQIQEIWNKASGAIPGWSRHIAYARAIEAAHGIK